MAGATSNGSPGTGRPWYVQLLIVLAPIVLLIGLPWAVLDTMGRSALQGELEAIRLAGAPTTYDELEAALPDIPDDQNAALVVYALADRLGQVQAECERNLQIPLFRRRTLPEPGEPYPAEMVAAVETLLTEQADLLAAVDRLRDLERGCLPPEVVWSPDSGAVGASCRTAARLKALDAVRKARAGRMDEAVTDCLTILHVGGALAESPTVVGVLVAMSCDGSAVNALERVLAAGSCSEAVLVEADEALVKALASRSIVTGIIGERVALIEQLVNGRPLPGTDALMAMPGRTSFGRGWWRRSVAAALELLAPLADPQLSVREAIAAAKDYDAKVEALPWHRSLAKTMLLRLQGSFELQGRCVAKLRCARLAIAAERYRLRTGHWPDTPASLVPDYLDDLPTDPFNDQPLRYRRTETGITIYSIGQDETDDNGNVGRQPSRTQRPPDVGFRLLDPAHRHAG